MLTINWAATPVIQGINAATDFSATLTPADQVYPPVSINELFSDVTIALSTSSYTTHGQQLTVVDSPISPGHTSVIQNPSVASISPSGFIGPSITNTNGTGFASLYVETNIGTRGYGGSFSTTGKVTSAQSGTYVAGTLGKHIYDTIAAMFNSQTPSDSTTAWFTSNNGNVNAPAVVLNPSRWTTFGQEAISVMHASTGATATFPAALVETSIGNKFVIFAWHINAYFPVGEKIVWLDKNSAYQTGTLASVSNVGDIGIGYLTSAVPVVTPFKILPNNYLSYLPSCAQNGTQVSGVNYLFYQLPSIMKSERGLTDNGGDWLKVIGLCSMTGLTQQGMPLNAEMSQWCSSVNKPIDSGDSGSPQFVSINGNAVLLGMPYQVPVATNIAGNATAVESAMSVLAGTPVTLARADLTSFTSF